MTIAYCVTTSMAGSDGKRRAIARLWTPSIERAFAELIAAPGRGRRMYVCVDDQIHPDARANIERVAAQ